MSITLGLVANVYNEANALPGWIETHLPHFDDVRVLHAGPQGDYSDDGTIELLDKWRIPVQFTTIDEGFGAVRSEALRMSQCDYVMLLDADERFYALHRVMKCKGDETPQDIADTILNGYHYRDGHIPDWNAINQLGSDLRVDIFEPYNQMAYLRDVLEKTRPDAVCTVRRHWHDMTFRRPTQNWQAKPDWQMRLVRNDASIHFDSDTRMHERIVGVGNSIRSDMERGPFFDHFHFTFKRMEQGQRAHDVEIYDAIHAGKIPPTKTPR